MKSKRNKHKVSIDLWIFIALAGWTHFFRIPLYEIQITTHLVLILASYSTCRLLLFFTNNKKNTTNRLNYIFITVLIVEILLSILPEAILNDHQGKFVLTFSPEGHNQHYTKSPHSSYTFTRDEYSYDRTANNLGFSDYEWNQEKSDSIIRILCLGDSFTEGDGTHFDSTYVQFLSRSLKGKYENLELMNAGSCGSDPFFNFKSLTDLLIDYQPDIILQSFTTNDYYHDIFVRGGFERFKDDGSLEYRKKHWWVRLYAASYISRVLIRSIGQYDKWLNQKHELANQDHIMEEQATKLFQAYKSFTDDKGISLILFSFPFKQEYGGRQLNNEFHARFSPIFSSFDLNFYNLQPCYEEYIIQQGDSFTDYYWNGDGHHNAQGYEMMAKCLKTILESHLTTL